MIRFESGPFISKIGRIFIENGRKRTYFVILVVVFNINRLLRSFNQHFRSFNQTFQSFNQNGSNLDPTRLILYRNGNRRLDFVVEF